MIFELPILGDCGEILGKCQNCFGIEPSAQSSLQKENFCNGSQKMRRSSYQSFLLLLIFAWFLYFWKILSRIEYCQREHIFVYNSSQSTSNFNVLIFFQTSKSFSNCNANIKSDNCWKVPNLTLFLICHWKKCHWKPSIFVWWCFFDRNNFFDQTWSLFKKWNHYSKCWQQMKNCQTIMDLTFWNFTTL